MLVCVTDPVKKTESLNTHICYRVRTQIRGAIVSDVERRYNNFKLLTEQLADELPGVIVPPLPDSQAIGRFTPEFVEQRRQALEVFIRRVLAHDELSGTDTLRSFLNEPVFRSTKPVSTTPASLFSAWDTATASLATMREAALRPGNEARSPADAQFDELQAYVVGLEEKLQQCLKTAQMLVRRQRELANTTFEYGLAMTLLGQSESGLLGASLTKVGHTADQLSVVAAEQADKEARAIEARLYDYAALVAAARGAIGQRTEKCKAMADAKAELEKRRAMHSKLLGNGKVNEARVAEDQMQRAQEEVEKTHDVLQRCEARLLREIHRFKQEKARDLRAVCVSYVKLQVEKGKQIEQTWAGVVFDDEEPPSQAPPPPPPPPSATPGAGGLDAGDDDDTSALVGV